MLPSPHQPSPHPTSTYKTPLRSSAKANRTTLLLHPSLLFQAVATAGACVTSTPDAPAESAVEGWSEPEPDPAAAAAAVGEEDGPAVTGAAGPPPDEHEQRPASAQGGVWQPCLKPCAGSGIRAEAVNGSDEALASITKRAANKCQ